MTIERLNQYRWIISNIKAITSEIDSFYEPIASPNGHQAVGGGKSVMDVGDPTTNAVNRILELKEQLDREQRNLEGRIEEIHAWMELIMDLEVKAIIRRHFILGKTWMETSIETYGVQNRDYCRKRFYRFKEENPDLFL